ncbi:MAG: hypothetical protein ACM33B_15560 [Pseudomonadota bacterium]
MARRQCTKRPYATLAEARAAILAMASRYHGIVYKKAYRCATCKAWHVTSTPPPRGRRIQR